MIGGRMIMGSSALESEMLALRKRVDDLEEQVRTLTAANLALVRSMENLHHTARSAMHPDDRLFRHEAPISSSLDESPTPVTA
ncbi:hypothetical protein ABGB18_45205 [Nonomuraea sp. B12E4]|uniref:hypothetical protein n=1 Tax=Nonomuraea sp. B12E4 TaxID=3153564 RepID=UPI00325DC6C8